MRKLSHEEFLALCEENGYLHPTTLPDGRQAAVHVRIFNTQILVGMDRFGYEDAY